MKKLVLVALIVSLMTPVSAQAAETKFTGGPLTNLDYQGARKLFAARCVVYEWVGDRTSSLHGQIGKHGNWAVLI